VPKKAIIARVLPVLAVAAVLALSFLNPGKVQFNGKLVACAGYGNSSYGYVGTPSVTSVNPIAGAIAGGTTVTITGQGYCDFPGSVHFGATAATSFVVNSDTSITAVSPAHVAGVVDVTVTTAGGTSAATAADHFTYTTFTYYFQWFDRASPGMMNDNIHLVNTSGSTANVIASMGGTSVVVPALAPGAGTYTSFAQGMIGGPVVVNSDQAILVSQRVQYYQSFNEVLAETAAQAATTSYFQWYDHASSPGFTNDNIHVLNPGTTTASVTVHLNTSSVVLSIPAGGEGITGFPGQIGGRGSVTSTTPVLASQRVQYFQSFNEVWAETAAQAAAVSYFNWFDKASPGMMNDNIHVYNPGAVSATVTVSIPSGVAQIQTVPAFTEGFISLPAGNIGGPVTVSSTQPVLASQRVQYYSSFNEVWAETAAQASTTLHFTWYDKVSSPGFFNDNIHVLNPGVVSVTVTVALTGATSQVVVVAAGSEGIVAFPGHIGTPVMVTSVGGPVLSSQRVQYYQSFNEIWGA
jgi:hypothetical protein